MLLTFVPQARNSLPIFEPIVGKTSTPAMATIAANSAYSTRSWPRSSRMNRSSMWSLMANVRGGSRRPFGRLLGKLPVQVVEVGCDFGADRDDRPDRAYRDDSNEQTVFNQVLPRIITH